MYADIIFIYLINLFLANRPVCRGGGHSSLCSYRGACLSHKKQVIPKSTQPPIH